MTTVKIDNSHATTLSFASRSPAHFSQAARFLNDITTIWILSHKNLKLMVFILIEQFFNIFSKEFRFYKLHIPYAIGL
ncbi:hypothetical protein Sesv_3655 [Salmonella enterica subsp. enterica serovar Virchow str. SVQ1]|uniref:Uncharacterized protein n=1 Tax=Salmonella virchow (strain SL491) TaxID=465517 RepID=A0A6C8F257_SALV4|nr:conserved hypothetical protein [Salmonella enterica subsp. enterica serovar Virchow str. SL491]ETO87355.1 hypothetical protein Sesv_3655 [Salmonella enterica subsp. enterica serovar Virchow str. SVQ1]